MRGLCLACIVLCGGLVSSQEEVESTTAAPVVIIKQVNEINEDGSYTVGYEASDGTFKLETRDTEGNVEGKYVFFDETGEIKIVEYSANNRTGFSTDLTGPVDTAVGPTVPAAPALVDPAFALEQERHNAVLAHQKNVIARQQEIAQQRELDAQRQAFASQQSGVPSRLVFNTANFNPQQPTVQQFNQRNFNQNFQQFQQQQQFLQQPQRFAPQQFVQQPPQFQAPQNQQFPIQTAFEQPRSQQL